MNHYAVFFGFLLLLAVAVPVCFELLLCRLYTSHRTDWYRLGAPTNLCRPSLSNYFSGSLARWSASRTWLFRRPAWVKGDRLAEILYVMFRWSAISILLGVFGFVVGALLIS